MNNAQLINQDSGDTEYYTPLEIISAARLVMGSIDLDPFSSGAANERVRAKWYFDESTDGLSQDWSGNVWMNHPFSREYNRKCIEKLFNEYEAGNVGQACCITFAATSEQWFMPLHRFPQCYLVPRTNYYLPNGERKTGVTKGSVVTYMGHRREQFRQEFIKHGMVKFPA